MFYHLLRPGTVFPTPANSFSNGFCLNNSFIGRAEMFNGLCFYTTISDIAGRPRHASLKLTSTVQYLEHSLLLLVTLASDLPMRAIMFCCLRRNVEAFCHKIH